MVLKKRLKPLYVFTGLCLAIYIVLAIAMRTADAPWSVPAWMQFLCVASPIKELVTHPWTLVTYGFVHWQFGHMFFNLLWLWCFGLALLRCHDGQRKLWTAFGAGLLGGAIAFEVASGSQTGMLAGASAGVLGVAGCAAVLMGRQRVAVFGTVSIIMLWLAVLLMVLILANDVDAPRQMAAHIGGIAGGIAAGLYHRFKVRGSRFKKTEPLTETEEADLNKLLQTVTNSGFNSLPEADRQRLFSLTKRKHRTPK